MSTYFSRTLTAGSRWRHLMVAGAAAAAMALPNCTRQPPAAPPIPSSLGEGDPAVVKVVEEALDAVRTAPREADNWGRLARVYDANGFADAGRRAYEQAVALDPTQARWWYRLGVSRAGVGDLRGAVEAADRAGDLAPSYAPTHWRRGQWLLELGDLQGSAASFERATQKDPGDAAGWLGLARVQLLERRPEAAVALLERLLAGNSTLSPATRRFALHLLGSAYRQLGRVDRTRAAITSGAALGGDREPAWSDPWSDELRDHRRGFATELKDAVGRLTTGDVKGAIEILERLRLQRPRDVALLNYLARARGARGELDEAIALLDRARLEAPADVITHLNLASIYFEKNDLPRAELYVDRAIALEPALAKAYETRGLIFWRLGRRLQAIEAFKVAVDHDASALQPLVWIGMIHGEMNRFDAALATFEEVASRDATIAEAFIGIGMVKMNRGAFDEADAAYRRAAALKPDDGQLRAARQRLREVRESRDIRSARGPLRK